MDVEKLVSLAQTDRKLLHPITHMTMERQIDLIIVIDPAIKYLTNAVVFSEQVIYSSIMENDGRKTTGGALLERRKQAIRLWKSKGVKHTYSSIAELLGVTRQTVKKWIDSWTNGGNSALVPKRRGRKTSACRDLQEQQER